MQALTPEMIEVAAKAYRAACTDGGTVFHGHRFDARINWNRQCVELTNEIGTVAIDFRNEAFMAASGSN